MFLKIFNYLSLDWICRNFTICEVITVGIIFVTICSLIYVFKNFLYKVVRKIYHQIGAHPLYFWTSFWTLFGLLFGLAVLSLSVKIKNIDFGIIAIWAAAYFLLGALVGCIFGVPKAVSEHTTFKNANNRNVISNLVVDKTSLINRKKAQEAKIGTTNLTDVSDWLSKIVLGAGLVQLNKIPGFVLHVAQVMSTGINLDKGVNSKVLCAGIIVYYTSFGLIAGYFIMRAIFRRLMEIEV